MLILAVATFACARGDCSTAAAGEVKECSAAEFSATHYYAEPPPCLIEEWRKSRVRGVAGFMAMGGGDSLKRRNEYYLGDPDDPDIKRLEKRIIGDLRSGDISRVRMGISMVRDLRFGRLAPQVAAVLKKDSDSHLRAAVISPLIWLGHKWDARELVKIARDPTADRGNRTYILMSLGMIATEKAAREVLTEFVQGDDPVLAVYAAEGLSDLGDNSGLAVCLETLKGDDYMGKQMALRALGKMGATEALPELEKMVAAKDDSSGDRRGRLWARFAQEAIEKIHAYEKPPLKRIAYLEEKLSGKPARWMMDAMAVLACKGYPRAVQIIREMARDLGHPANAFALGRAEFHRLIPRKEVRELDERARKLKLKKQVEQYKQRQK